MLNNSLYLSDPSNTPQDMYKQVTKYTSDISERKGEVTHFGFLNQIWFFRYPIADRVFV
jgi:hypothetical protein